MDHVERELKFDEIENLIRNKFNEEIKCLGMPDMESRILQNRLKFTLIDEIEDVDYQIYFELMDFTGEEPLCSYGSDRILDAETSELVASNMFKKILFSIYENYTNYGLPSKEKEFEGEVLERSELDFVVTYERYLRPIVEKYKNLK